MALAENIRQKINNNLTTLLSSDQDCMIIGGYANNLLTTDGYLTIRPFLFNAKIEQGVPFQFSSKVFIPQGEVLSAIASGIPISVAWNSDDIDDWNSGNDTDWNSAQPGEALILLTLTMAGI